MGTLLFFFFSSQPVVALLESSAGKLANGMVTRRLALSPVANSQSGYHPIFNPFLPAE